MTTSRAKPRKRHPEELASRWQGRGNAYLSDRLCVPGLFRILAGNSNSATDIALLRADYSVHKQRPGDERFSIDWQLVKGRGSNPGLARILGSTVHFTCIPPPGPFNPDGLAPPQSDMLFHNGELELFLPAKVTGEKPKESFKLGSVLGLSIVTRDHVYPVWPSVQPRLLVDIQQS